MAGKIVHILQIIDIINLHFEVLALLKVILDIETLDPGGVEVVTDDLSHADALPLVSEPAVEHDHAVSARERIQVRQIAAGERKSNCRHKSRLGSFNSLVDSGKNSVIQVSAGVCNATSRHCTCILVSSHARKTIANGGSCVSHLKIYN